LGLSVIVLFDEKMKSAKTTRSTTNNNMAAVAVAAANTTTSISNSSSKWQIEELVKLLHSYPIGNSRSVLVDEDNDVWIVDERENGKRAIFHCSTMGSICTGDSQH